MSKLLLISTLSLVSIILLAGCTKVAPAGTTAPTVSSENVETASSSVESTSGNFVSDATPTSDQVVPDLT